MAKKKIMAKPMMQSDYHHGKGCFALMGLVLIALGLWAYLDEANLKIIVAFALVLLGLKKIFMAARCC